MALLSYRSTFAVALLVTSACGGDDVGDGLPTPDAREDDDGPSEALDPAEALAGAIVHMDERRNVPSLLWFVKNSATKAKAATEALPRGSYEVVARRYLARYSRVYRVSEDESRTPVLTDLHDTGDGPLIATFQQRANGIDVFKQKIRVVTNRQNELIALSGNMISTESVGYDPLSGFDLSVPQAAARAIADLTRITIDADAIRANGEPRGDYSFFALDTSPWRIKGTEPVRAKQVYYPKDSTLVPAYYLELQLEVIDDPPKRLNFAYVVSASDGRILFRNNMTVNASYKVWADAADDGRFMNSPYGNNVTPHPTGDVAAAQTFTAGSQATVDSLIAERLAGSPWLANNATYTSGNNVQAYTDWAVNDGYDSTDIRADTTDGTYNFTFNAAAEPSTTANAKAGIVQLFYTLNYLHDWFYIAGFNEASGNAQLLNFGKGGQQGDPIKAEAQDYGGMNGASMTPGADGTSPKLEMYRWSNTVSAASITAAGVGVGLFALTPTPAKVGYAEFGPTTFNVSARSIVYTEPKDACTEIQNKLALGWGGVGQIAFIDRGGGCTFANKVANAAAAGAAAAIIANVGGSSSPDVPPQMIFDAAFPIITIPSLSLNMSDGDSFRTRLSPPPPALPTATSGSMTRTSLPNLDSSIDSQLIAHEFGHLLTHRLVGDGSGLTTLQAQSLDEGWADFVSMIATVDSTDDFDGVYSVGVYAPSAASPARNYFGMRRYPYSTDKMKNPLTFKHLADNVALPDTNTVPNNPNITTPNSEIHNAGEIWAAMLWDGYAGMLTSAASQGATFKQMRDRMKKYLVESLKIVPEDPTFLEARAALLLTIAENQKSADYEIFRDAFAQRGAGTFAEGPDRNSITNTPITESYETGSWYPSEISLSDEISTTCGGNERLDNGEVGTLTIKLLNISTQTKDLTTTLSSSTQGITLDPSGTGNISFSSVDPGDTETATVKVTASGMSATERSISFSITLPLDPGTITRSLKISGNYVDAGNQSNTDDFESPIPTWTKEETSTDAAWERVGYGSNDHVYRGVDADHSSDLKLISPPLTLAQGKDFIVTVKHRYQFEQNTSRGWFYDGGVIEISIDGTTWEDVGSALSGGYPGTIFTDTDPANINPLSGRPGFVGASSGFPEFTSATLNFGTAHAGKTVRLRFRVGADSWRGDFGWEIDDVVIQGLANKPFRALVTKTVCEGPLADAGPDQTVLAGKEVTLDGTATVDPYGETNLTYEWTQTVGDAVTLSPGSEAPLRVFRAPAVATETTLTFQLVATNSGGVPGPSSTVNVLVQPALDTLNPDGPAQPTDEGSGGCGCSSSEPSGRAGWLPLLVGLGWWLFARRHRGHHTEVSA